MKNEDLSTVIVQDSLNTFGGGERVVHWLSEALPGNVEIITGNYNPNATYDFSHCKVIELNKNSFFSFTVSRLTIDWKKYDIAILSGNRPQFIQWANLPIPTIRYCHSPARTFWSLRDREFRNADFQGKIARIVTAPTYRAVDVYLNKKHDEILVNSHNIRSQVDRFYGQDSTVVYPPIKVNDFSYDPAEDYWLSVNRLVPKNRVELQINSFEEVGEKLIIVGSVDEQFEKFGNKLRTRIQNIPNIQLESSVAENKLISLYSKAKGVIYTPYYEDFGIVPVEAMASGKPVLAIAEGGPIETIIDSQTGWLIAPTQKHIKSVVTSDFNPEKFRIQCESRAKKFDEERFKNIILDIIGSYTNY